MESTYLRSLTYRRRLESLRKKLTSCVALLRRLAGSRWGAGATTLRIATLALVHSTAEYCAPVWCRIVTGCLHPTPADNLPSLAGIQPAELRRIGATLSFSTPCHEAWTFAPLSAHPPIECKRTAPQIETPIRTRRTTSHQFIWQQKHTCGAVGGLPMERRVDGQPHRHRHPPRDDPPKKSLGLA